MSIDYNKLKDFPFDWPGRLDGDKLYYLRLALGEALGGLSTCSPNWAIDIVEEAETITDCYYRLRKVMAGSDKERQEALERCESNMKIAREHRKQRHEEYKREGTVECPKCKGKKGKILTNRDIKFFKYIPSMEGHWDECCYCNGEGFVKENKNE